MEKAEQPRSEIQGKSAAQFPLDYSDLIQSFASTHSKFVEHLPKLLAVVHKVFPVGVVFEKDRKLAEKIVLGLGRVCVEDFNEIMCLAAHGYSIGALKLVRGLFERVVTACYIAENPKEAEKFAAYSHMQKWRLSNTAKAFFGEAYINKVGAKQIEKWRKNMEAVRDQFKTICDNCGRHWCEKCQDRYGTMPSWSKLNPGAMARKTIISENTPTKDFEKFYLVCFLEPTSHIHATLASIYQRLEERPDGSAVFSTTYDRKQQDKALWMAHSLIIIIADVVARHFDMGLNSEISELCNNFWECWKGFPGADNPVPAEVSS